MAPKKKTTAKKVATQPGSGASSGQGAAATSSATAEGSLAAQGFAVGWRVTRTNARDCGIQLVDGLTEEQCKRKNAPRVAIESTSGSGNEEGDDSHDDSASEPSQADVASAAPAAPAAPAKRVTRSDARNRGIQLLDGLTEEQLKKKKAPRLAIESTGGTGNEEDEDSHDDSRSEPFEEDVSSAAPARRVTRSSARDRGIQLLDGLTKEQFKKKKAHRATIVSTGGSGKEGEGSDDDNTNEPFRERDAQAAPAKRSKLRRRKGKANATNDDRERPSRLAAAPARRKSSRLAKGKVDDDPANDEPPEDATTSEAPANRGSSRRRMAKAEDSADEDPSGEAAAPSKKGSSAPYGKKKAKVTDEPDRGDENSSGKASTPAKESSTDSSKRSSKSTDDDSTDGEPSGDSAASASPTKEGSARRKRKTEVTYEDREDDDPSGDSAALTAAAKEDIIFRGKGKAKATDDDHEIYMLRQGPITPVSPAKESSGSDRWKGKSIATSEDSAKNKPCRASGYTIIMEACKQTYEFQKAAKDLRCELRTAFPAISVRMVDKPRKRCFEVRSKSGEIFLQHLNLEDPFTELESIDAAQVIEDIDKKFSLARRAS